MSNVLKSSILFDCNNSIIHFASLHFGVSGLTFMSNDDFDNMTDAFVLLLRLGLIALSSSLEFAGVPALAGSISFVLFVLR